MAEPIKPVTSPKVVPPPPVTKEVDPKVEMLKTIGDILTSFGGKESDIPLHHEYWTLVNRYRGL